MLVLTSLALLAGCGTREEVAGAGARPTGYSKSRVVFVEADGKTDAAAPKEDLRLWVPYVVGDLYGEPNEGELAPVALKPDLSFSLDLNKSHEKLMAGAGPHRVLAEVDDHRTGRRRGSRACRRSCCRWTASRRWACASG